MQNEKAGNNGSKRNMRDCPSIEDYLNMNEEEKDRAIHEAVIRLQTRIQEIIYLMRLEMKTKTGSFEDLTVKDKKKNTH